jgi:hypothetical protein
MDRWFAELEGMRTERECLERVVAGMHAQQLGEAWPTDRRDPASAMRGEDRRGSKA